MLKAASIITEFDDKLYVYNPESLGENDTEAMDDSNERENHLGGSTITVNSSSKTVAETPSLADNHSEIIGRI